MLANYITIIRGILAIVLIFYGKLDVCFWVMYCICGISDVLDGYVARKTSTVSSMGAMLDTVADLIFTIAIIKLVYPLVILNLLLCICCIVIAIIKLLTIIVIFKKYRKVENLHTKLNKFTGIIIFISIFFINTLLVSYIFLVVCIITIITSTLDLLYGIKTKNINEK